MSAENEAGNLMAKAMQMMNRLPKMMDEVMSKANEKKEREYITTSEGLKVYKDSIAAEKKGWLGKKYYVLNNGLIIKQ